jgi:hypothetical protein
VPPTALPRPARAAVIGGVGQVRCLLAVVAVLAVGVFFSFSLFPGPAAVASHPAAMGTDGTDGTDAGMSLADDAEPCAHCDEDEGEHDPVHCDGLDGDDVPGVSPDTPPWTVPGGERPEGPVLPARTSGGRPRAGPDPSPPDLHLLQRLRV